MTTKKTLLYYDVAERIKAYITVTPLAVGALLPPERLLAQKLDVSVVTVRKALDCLVNESVIEKLARRGNRVLNVPVPEGGKRKKRVGITIWLDAGAEHPETLGAIARMGEEFPAAEYEIVILYITREVVEKNAWGVLLDDQGLSGMLVKVQEIPTEILHKLKGMPFPVVFLHREEFVPGCWINPAPGMDKLIRYLTDLGHETIAYASGSKKLPSVKRMADAFEFSCGQLGLRAENRIVVFGEYNEPCGYDMTVRLLLSRPCPPTAIVLGDEFMVMGAYRALAELGLNCPQDISIVCASGGTIMERLHPPVTSLCTSGLMQSCIRMLRELIEGAEMASPDRSLVFEQELYVRASTGKAYSAHRPSLPFSPRDYVPSKP
jgi:LacI family transcriptional regulator